MVKVMLIAGFSLIVLGDILIISYFINKNKNKRCSEETQGRLVDIVEREDSDGPIPSMYVYSYRVNGAEYQLKSTAVNKQVDRVGDSCTIWYNPAKPKEAQEFHYESNKIYNFILISGIVMALSGMAILCIGLIVSTRIQG